MMLRRIEFFALACCCLAAASAHAERGDRDKPINLEAGKVYIDDAHQTSTFTGDVVLTQGTIAIRGDQIVVVQTKEGFKHGTATGNLASFRQKREGVDEYVEGYGERIEYDTGTGIMDIVGRAHVKRGQDDVRGEHIIYNTRTEVFQVTGGAAAQALGRPQGRPPRVTVTIQPKGPAASAPSPSESLHIRPETELTKPEEKR